MPYTRVSTIKVSSVGLKWGVLGVRVSVGRVMCNNVSIFNKIKITENDVLEFRLLSNKLGLVLVGLCVVMFLYLIKLKEQKTVC